MHGGRRFGETTKSIVPDTDRCNRQAFEDIVIAERPIQTKMMVSKLLDLAAMFCSVLLKTKLGK